MATTDYASIIKTEPDANKMREQIAEGIGQAQDTAQNSVDTANAAKAIADNANSRVDEIVKGTGASDSPEVADSHHDNITGTNYDSLGKRMDAHSAQLADIMINVKLFGAKGNAKYRKYTESYWQDITHTIPLYKKDDGTFYTDSGFTSQCAGTIYAKPESITYWQDSACTIPATDDSQAFTNALSYLNSLGRTATLYCPDGSYLLNNYNLIIDVAKFKVKGGHATKLISTGLAANSKFVTFTNTGGMAVYDYMQDALKGITLEGSYFQQNADMNDGVIGLYFDKTILLPHKLIKRLTVLWFNIGTYQSVGAYKEIFNECAFIANDISLDFDDAPGTGGVPIIFNNCFLECNTLAIRLHTTGSGEIRFIGGAIEYNSRVVDCYGDNISFENVHFEMDLNMASNSPFRCYAQNDKARITLKDCWMTLLPNGALNVGHWIPTPIIYSEPSDHVFENIIPDGVSYTGSYILDIYGVSINFNQTMNTDSLIGGNASNFSNVNLHIDSSWFDKKILIDDSNSAYYNSNFSIDDSLISVQYKLNNWYVCDRDSTMSDHLGTSSNVLVDYDGTNGQSGGRCLKIKKVANSGLATVRFVIPIVSKVNGIIIKLSYKLGSLLQNPNSKITAKIYSAYWRDSAIYIVQNKTGLMSQIPSLNNSTSYVDTCLYAQKPPQSANCYMLEFGLSSAIETLDINLFISSLIVNFF